MTVCFRCFQTKKAKELEKDFFLYNNNWLSYILWRRGGGGGGDIFNLGPARPPPPPPPPPPHTMAEYAPVGHTVLVKGFIFPSDLFETR